jgi:homoserine kinase
MVTMRAPATSANLGSGFDVFGVALDRPTDVVTVERADETTIEVTGEGSRTIPENPEKNTVGAVAEALDAPAHISIEKGIRPASGLGSSAASAAAAAVGLNELYDRGLSRRELVPVAAQGEAVVSGDPHNDNVAPSLLGGFTIATDSTVERIEADVPVVVCLPEIEVPTEEAREILPEHATLDQLVTTVGNAATLTSGMHRGDPELVGQGMDDSVVTPARAELVSGYDDVREAALDAGGTGVTISGAGPSVLAVCHSAARQDVASAMVDAFGTSGIDATVYESRVSSGATICESCTSEC